MGKNGSAKDEGKGTGAAKGRLNGGSQAVTILLFGLLPAAAVFTIAYLAFVNAQRTYLTNRNYRVLATASDQISGRFEGIEKALRSRLAVGDEATPFLTFDSSSEHVRQTWQSSKSAEAGKEAALDRVRASVSDAGGRAMMQFRYYADANDEEGKPLATSDLLKLVSSILLRDEFDDVLLIRPPNDVLYQRRTAETGAVPDLAGLLARADLAGGERSNFDALLGAIGKGTGKKETTSKEEAKPGGDPRAARARLFSEPIHTRYLGDRYLLFFRPVQFPPAIRSMLMKTSASPGKRPGAEVGKQEEPEWWLCGLVYEARFANETRRIPTTWLVAALFLLAMALLAWPLLKVWYIGPRERFRAFDVALLAVSALISSALMTFALLDSYAYADLAGEFDGELVRLARQIEHNFGNELRHVYDQLAAVQSGAVTECGPGVGARCCPARMSGKAKLSGCRPEYPYFDRLMVIDATGKPKYGWKAKPPSRRDEPWEIVVDDKLPTHLRLADRPYFEEAQSGDMWRYEFEGEGERDENSEGRGRGEEGQDDKNGRRLPAVFAIESLQARTTGENTVVMAVPLDASKTDGKPADKEVAIIATRLLSVIDAVMPPGFGFAVIDRLGKVLLHSDEKRNLHENLFLECDQNQNLYDAVVARRAAHVDVRYDGKERRLYVHPMHDTDWTLVVFADKTIAGSLNAELSAAWLIAFLLLYALPYLLVGAVVLTLQGGGSSGWLWPDSRRIRSYLAIGILLSIAAAVVLEGMDRGDALVNLAIIGLTPLFTLSLLRVTLGPPPRSKPLQGVVALAALLASGGGILFLSYGDVGRSDSPGTVVWTLLLIGGAAVLGWAVAEAASARTPSPLSRPDPAALCRSYAFFLASLLLVLSVAPAAVVFSDAQRQASVALVKFGQRRFAFALQARSEKLKDRYADSEYAPALFDRLATDVDRYTAAMYTDRLDLRPVEDGASVTAAPAAPAPVRRDRWTRRLCGGGGTRNDGDPGTEAPVEPQAACVEWVQLLTRNFTALVTSFIPTLGEDMGHLWPRLYDSSSDLAWRWEVVGSQRLRYVLVDQRLRSKLGPENEPVDLVMEGRWRALSLPSATRGWMLLLLLGAGAGAASVFLFASVVRRVFLLDPEGFVDAVQPALPGSGAWLFVHLADRPSEDAARVTHPALLDLSTLTKAEQCEQWRESAAKAEVAVVDHFEHRHEEAEWRAAKVALVEALAAEPTRTVVLLSEIDPVEYGAARAAESEEAGVEKGLNEVARWSRALSTFRRCWWQPSEEGEAGKSALPEGGARDSPRCSLAAQPSP